MPITDVYPVDPQSVAIREAGKTAFLACTDTNRWLIRDGEKIVGIRIAVVDIDGNVEEFAVPMTSTKLVPGFAA